MKLMASLAPARAELETGVVAKADQFLHGVFNHKQIRFGVTKNGGPPCPPEEKMKSAQNSQKRRENINLCSINHPKESNHILCAN
jgi:hypothetical protein